MGLRFKSFDVTNVKADSEGGDFHFEGYASRFDNEDSYGDVIRKGAFTDSISATSGRYNLFLDHSSNQFDSSVGYVEANQDNKGLRVKGYLDVDSDERARRSLEKMRARSAKGIFPGMSIGFSIGEGDYTIIKDTGGWDITRADVAEVSLTWVPANGEATVDSVKSFTDRIKSGELDEAIIARIQSGAFDEALVAHSAIAEREEEVQDFAAEFAEANGIELDAVKAIQGMEKDALAELIEKCGCGCGRCEEEEAEPEAKSFWGSFVNQKEER